MSNQTLIRLCRFGEAGTFFFISGYLVYKGLSEPVSIDVGQIKQWISGPLVATVIAFFTSVFILRFTVRYGFYLVPHSGAMIGLSLYYAYRHNTVLPLTIVLTMIAIGLLLKLIAYVFVRKRSPLVRK